VTVVTGLELGAAEATHHDKSANLDFGVGKRARGGSRWSISPWCNPVLDPSRGGSLANVVLEYSSFRVPIPMFQAMCARGFTAGEMRVVLTLLRLMDGPRRDQTIRISHAALARETGIRFSGAFVRSVRHVISRGVVVIVERASGRRPPRYSLCGRPELWRTVRHSDSDGTTEVQNATVLDSAPRAPTKPRYLSVRHSRHAAQLAG
jgi:hypothetical protein